MAWRSRCATTLSPAWIIPRLALDDHTLIDVPIRKGSSVLIPVHWVHHDERWWPEPERYYRPSGSSVTPARSVPLGYLPFGVWAPRGVHRPQLSR